MSNGFSKTAAREQEQRAKAHAEQFSAFERDLANLIDEHGISERVVNMPPHVLARLAVQQFALVAQAVVRTEMHYAQAAEPASQVGLITPHQGIIVP